MFKVIIIGVGGFIGAVARYGVSGFVHRYLNGSFPFGTLCVNVLGCLFIGVLMYLIESRQLFSSSTRSFVLIGFLGSFTTFSTYGFETFALLRSGNLRLACLNMGLNLVFGLAAVIFGWVAARAVSM